MRHWRTLSSKYFQKVTAGAEFLANSHPGSILAHANGCNGCGVLGRLPGANNALLYTLMANCKIQGLDPEIYLTEVIKRLPHHATAQQAAGLTPARFAAALRAEAQAAA